MPWQYYAIGIGAFAGALYYTGQWKGILLNISRKETSAFKHEGSTLIAGRAKVVSVLWKGAKSLKAFDENNSILDVAGIKERLIMAVYGETLIPLNLAEASTGREVLLLEYIPPSAALSKLTKIPVYEAEVFQNAVELKELLNRSRDENELRHLRTLDEVVKDAERLQPKGRIPPIT